MSPQPVFMDIHAPYVKLLAEAGDWAGLARYWMAHQHEPALDAAIACARVRSGTDNRWQALADHLEERKSNQLNIRLDPPAVLVVWAKGTGSTTLELLQLYAKAALCDRARSSTPDTQPALLRFGLEIAAQGNALALACADVALAAFFVHVAAHLLAEMRRFSQAAQVYAKALKCYRRLQAQNGNDSHQTWRRPASIGRLGGGAGEFPRRAGNLSRTGAATAETLSFGRGADT
jgi:tetratricopeptide (TPR) repeat protein